MKKLEKGFTSPDESKKLLDMGLPYDSADFYYHKAAMDKGLTRIYSCGDETYSKQVEIAFKYEIAPDMLPSWSVGRLIEIFELCYTDRLEEHVWYNHPGKGNTIVERVLWDFENKKDRLDFSKLAD